LQEAAERGGWSKVHDASGIERSMLHDGAGIGRFADHHTAGIVRLMIHDAAGGLTPTPVLARHGPFMGSCHRRGIIAVMMRTPCQNTPLRRPSISATV
jgi:hypothetical protein